MLQVYAWANMIVAYSQDDGIAKAARDTFSGEKPCALCCKIASAREADRSGKSDPLVPLPPDLLSKLVQQMLPMSELRLAELFPRDVALPAFAGPPGADEPARAAPPIPPPRGEA